MLSIIVPVYNVSGYVNKCLNSIYAQSFSNYEVIVVNDGSTDGCHKLIDAFCEDKPNFHVYHKKNEGLMATWMFGVEKSVGDYIGFVDSDDYIHDTMFEKMYAIATRENIDIVMCDRFDVVNGCAVASASIIAPGEYIQEDMHIIYENILPKFSGEHITNARWNKIFRAQLLRNNLKYCESKSRICEDRFITPACMFNAKSFYYLDEPLYYYVLRNGSNHSMPSEKLQETLELLYRTQMQMIVDHSQEKYISCVERATLNWIRLMMERNFKNKNSFNIKLQLAERMYNSENYQRFVVRYNDDLVGRAGQLVKILFKWRAIIPFVLLLQLKQK